MTVYAKIGHFRNGSRFYAWLVRLAMNEAVTKLRRGYATSWVSLGEPADSGESISALPDAAGGRDIPEESYSQTELRKRLSRALEGLEAPLRLVFVVPHIAGLSSEETARVLGLSVATVKTRLMRARLKLRKKLAFDLSTVPLWSGGRPFDPRSGVVIHGNQRGNNPGPQRAR